MLKCSARGKVKGSFLLLFPCCGWKPRTKSSQQLDLLAPCWSYPVTWGDGRTAAGRKIQVSYTLEAQSRFLPLNVDLQPWKRRNIISVLNILSCCSSTNTKWFTFQELTYQKTTCMFCGNSVRTWMSLSQDQCQQLSLNKRREYLPSYNNHPSSKTNPVLWRCTSYQWPPTQPKYLPTCFLIYFSWVSNVSPSIFSEYRFLPFYSHNYNCQVHFVRGRSHEG